MQAIALDHLAIEAPHMVSISVQHWPMLKLMLLLVIHWVFPKNEANEFRLGLTYTMNFDVL